MQIAHVYTTGSGRPKVWFCIILFLIIHAVTFAKPVDGKKENGQKILNQVWLPCTFQVEV